MPPHLNRDHEPPIHARAHTHVQTSGPYFPFSILTGGSARGGDWGRRGRDGGGGEGRSGDSGGGGGDLASRLRELDWEISCVALDPETICAHTRTQT